VVADPYTETLVYAEWAPEEHPRDENGRFASGARVPLSDEVVDARDSPLNKWLLSATKSGLDNPSGIKSSADAYNNLKKVVDESSPENAAALQGILADQKAEYEKDLERHNVPHDLPSEAGEANRGAYKAAIAEHLGGVLYDEVQKNEKLRNELFQGPRNPEDLADLKRMEPDRETAQKDFNRGLITSDELHAIGYHDLEGQEDADRRWITSKASDFIHTWASTSADTHPKALAIQTLAAEMFGIPEAEHLKDARNANRSDINYVIDSEKETIRTLLRAQYDWTQAELAKAGITEATVYRGMKDVPRSTATGIDDRVNLQPLSSFSVEYKTARDFAFGGGDPRNQAVTMMRVPAKQIFSTAKTGFGCLNEGEVVVLGGHNIPAWTTWAQEHEGMGGKYYDIPPLESHKSLLSTVQQNPELQKTLTKREFAEPWDSTKHPRDEHGRFGDGSDVLEAMRADPRVGAADKMSWARGDVRNDPGVSVNKHYTPEAVEENRRIAASFLSDAAKAKAGEAPVAIIAVGRPGSGKTTLLNGPEAAELHLPQTVLINPDDVKERIAGYKHELAGAYHRRSTDIVKELWPMAITGNYNIMYDVSGRDPHQMVEIAGRLKDHGYKIHVIGVATNAKVANQRAYDRFLGGGRFTSPDFLSDHSMEHGPRMSYERLKEMADEWTAYNTSDDKPRLLEHGGKNSTKASEELGEGVGGRGAGGWLRGGSTDERGDDSGPGRSGTTEAGDGRRIAADPALDVYGIGEPSDDVEAMLRFDLLNHEVVSWVDARSAELVRQISEGQQELVRSLLHDSFVNGVTPTATAARIRLVVGLTDQQAGYIERYTQRLLENGTVPAKASALADRYRTNWVNYRANMIARTETTAASNEGQAIAWSQARARGYVDPELEETWIISPDTKACHECRELEGRRWPVGTGPRPPKHPG
jgi:predicted ABC-type ATPase